MKEDKLLKLLSAVMALVILGYLGISLYRSAGSNYKTETAYIRTVSEMADAQFFIIRDEKILTSESDGIVVSLARNGGKVSNGSRIAAVFSDEKNAKNYSESAALEKKLEMYRKIDSQARLANLDLNKLTDEIDSDFYSMLNSVYYNEYSSLSSDEISFSEKFSRKRISLGDDVDCSVKISELEAEISELTAVKPASYVTTDRAGFYVSRPDGYEGIIDSSRIDELTADELREAIASEKKKIPENCVGKIVNGFEWYAACIVPADSLSGIEAGRNMSIMLGDTDTVSARLYQKKLTGDNECLAVFRCSFMNEELAGMRKVTGKIIVRSYTGLRIRRDAVRFINERVEQEDGTYADVTREGVYIREGNLIKFNRIEEIYSNDDFVVARDKTGVAGWLSQYDQVVYSGKELKSGKVVK